jgi:hypothetical protein
MDKGLQVEEIQYLDDWLLENETNEDCVEFPETIPSELVILRNEIKLLKIKLSNQKVQIQDVKLELEESEEIVMNGNDARN